MLCVWSDFLSLADTRHVILLGLLDLSAAFDCVDDDMLLQPLEFSFGLMGLQWLRSFLTDRSQQVAYDGHLSSVHHLLFGGSVLGPLLYVLYTAELGYVVARHRMQLYTSMPTTAKYTPALLSVTLQQPSRHSLHASATSTRGCLPAGYD